MAIINLEKWKRYEDKNKDLYGKCCVDVAREVMRLLDERLGKFDTHKIICEADDNIRAGGITGFMAGAVAAMVSECHSRGEAFRVQWNADYGAKEDHKGVVNPALVTIGDRK